MTTATNSQRRVLKAVARPVTPTVKVAESEGVSEFVKELTKLATKLAKMQVRAELAEAKLAEHDPELVAENAALVADIVELNRALNYYGGQKGWCSDYEYLQRQVNERFKNRTVALQPRAGYEWTGTQPLAPDSSWRPLNF